MPTYLHHFILDDVADVFDASALWHAPGLPLFARKVQLRDLLERHPRLQKGRAISSCFSHVRLLLPSMLLDDDDHLFRSCHTQQLIASLRELHQRDFANLLDGQEVRYAVQADASLGPQQIGIQFGHALYLPAKQEAAQYQLQVSSDSVVWQEIGLLYPQQRLCLLGDGASEHSVAVLHWPAALAGALLLINDGPGCVLQLRVRPQAAFDLRFDESYYVLTALGNRAGVEVGQARRLLLKVQAVAKEVQAVPSIKPPAPKQAAQVWQVRPSASNPAPNNVGWATRPPIPMVNENASVELVREKGGPKNLEKSKAVGGSPTLRKTTITSSDTAYPCAPVVNADLTYVAIAAPKPSSHLRLVALALPRLSRYPQAGVSRLEFGFGKDMQWQCGAGAALQFSLDALDHLQVRTKAGQQAVPLPAHFEPVAGQVLDVLPVEAAMQELYAACLRLPANACGIQAPIPAHGRLAFGRNVAQLSHLRVLDRAAVNDAPQADKLSADRIGLSRVAFSMAVDGQGFQIWRESEGQALFHLDQDLKLVQAIATPEYLLPNGHHIVAGHYVLQLHTQH